MAMNYVRFQSVLGNMTTAAQKVYNAIPAQSAWTHDEIARELKRVGMHMDFRTMQGCVNSLCSAGLVRELQGAHFMRTEVRGKPGKPVKHPRRPSWSNQKPRTLLTRWATLQLRPARLALS